MLNKVEITNTIADIAKYNAIAKEADAILKELKAKLQTHMEEADVKEIVTDEHVAKLIFRNTVNFDRKGLEERYPDIAKEFETPNVSSYVKVA